MGRNRDGTYWIVSDFSNCLCQDRRKPCLRLANHTRGPAGRTPTRAQTQAGLRFGVTVRWVNSLIVSASMVGDRLHTHAHAENTDKTTTSVLVPRCPQLTGPHDHPPRLSHMGHSYISVTPPTGSFLQLPSHCAAGGEPQMRGDRPRDRLSKTPVTSPRTRNSPRTRGASTKSS